jgi:hypothetical protein
MQQSKDIALPRFYAAFNRADLDLIAAHWDESEDIVMNNPLGGITRGRTAIRDVDAKLFRGPAKITVAFYDYTLHRSQ